MAGNGPNRRRSRAGSSAGPDTSVAVLPACLDELVNVYLSPLKREEGPPIRTFLKLGPPPVHLRLPRRWLRMDVPEGQVDTENCSQKEFSGWRASYLRTSQLARGLGIPYDQPGVQDFLLMFHTLDPDKRQLPVNDSIDREGMAQKGTWIADPDYPILRADFCLSLPATAGQCYAAVARSMVYYTGSLEILAQAFSTATFAPPPTPLWTQITVADLNRYFAFLRRIAAAVVVAPTVSTP